MKSNQVQIEFTPFGVKAVVNDNESLLAACMRAGVLLENLCGGMGTCGRCKLELLECKMRNTVLKAPDIGWHLACEFGLNGIETARFRVSSTSRFQTLLPEDISDLDLLCCKNGFSGLLKLDTLSAKKTYAMVVDIGTTGISSVLIGNDGKIGSVSSYNMQASFGQDVISRAVWSENNEDGISLLSEAIVISIQQHIDYFCSLFSIKADQIKGICCVGNTFMLHSLFKRDLKALRTSEDPSFVGDLPVITASDLGFRIAEHAVCVPGYCPGVFVGSDAVSAALCAGVDISDDVVAVIDLGTNGEIVIGCKDWIVCCACSAGPAFEAISTGFGMMAQDGAITAVDMKDVGGRIRVDLSVKGNASAKGICSSGLVDFMACLKRFGLWKNDDFKDSEFVQRDGSGSSKFWLTKDVCILRDQVKGLTRSATAVKTGFLTALKELGLDTAKISKVFVTGALGESLRPDSLDSLGLFPGISKKNIYFVREAALVGASYFVCDKHAATRYRSIIPKITYLDLANSFVFMDCYKDILFSFWG